MTQGAWQFQTTKGVVTVDPDAIRIESTPGQILAGQRTRWQEGGSVERGKTVLWVAVLCFALVDFWHSVWRLLTDGIASSGLFWALPIGMTLILGFNAGFRDTTIQRESIERISLERTNRRLIVKYVPVGPVWRLLQAMSLTFGPRTRTYELPTDEEVQDAREAFRLRGLPVEDGPTPTGTVPTGFVVEDGVYYCESCRRQVSPTDRTCPACEFRLRTEPGTSSQDYSTAEV